MVNVRIAYPEDLPAIKKIADANKKEIGFIVRPIFEESIQNQELFVACKLNGEIVGFVRWHHRRDEWNTVYEICVRNDSRRDGIGKLLLAQIPKPIQLKCPVDNASNKFYEHIGFSLISKEQGRKRMLNLWVCVV
ncbi:MAG: GNAT family N-acetyltransferase [Candidatus Pacebacteria bacterium]|jgi:N-acetylglutamate synthase-like GNAT family acetyltransferase|nr:GNAT family N-acetyltransferase [Candidatus Paceibacterota bacterium]